MGFTPQYYFAINADSGAPIVGEHPNYDVYYGTYYNKPADFSLNGVPHVRGQACPDKQQLISYLHRYDKPVENVRVKDGLFNKIYCLIDNERLPPIINTAWTNHSPAFLYGSIMDKIGLFANAAQRSVVAIGSTAATRTTQVHTDKTDKKDSGLRRL